MSTWVPVMWIFEKDNYMIPMFYFFDILLGKSYHI